MDIQKKQNWKYVLTILAFLAVLAGWLALGKQGLLQLCQREMERQASLAEIERLTDENRALTEEVRRLSTDMEYVERMARGELGMVKDNEVIYRFGTRGDMERESMNPSRKAGGVGQGKKSERGSGSYDKSQ